MCVFLKYDKQRGRNTYENWWYYIDHICHNQKQSVLSSSNLFHISLHCVPTFSKTFQVSTAQTFQEHYANSLSLMPSARAHFGRGTCLAALRRRLEAMAELEKAKELCPKMVGAIINLAGLGLGNIWIFFDSVYKYSHDSNWTHRHVLCVFCSNDCVIQRYILIVWNILPWVKNMYSIRWYCL